MKRISSVIFILFSMFLFSPTWAASLQSRIEDQVKQEILKNLSVPQEKVRISLRNFAPLDFPQESKIEVWLTSSRQPKGIVPIKIEIYQENNFLKSMLLTAEVKIYDNVVVAAKKLERHEKTDDSYMTVENREVTDFTDKYFSTKQEIANKRTTGIIPQGRIIGESLLEDIPLINQGDKVKIVSQAGSVSIWTYGIASQDGKSGEKIKVKNVDTKKIILADVLDNQTVCIKLDTNF